jgi:hypothetical protein
MPLNLMSRRLSESLLCRFDFNFFFFLLISEFSFICFDSSYSGVHWIGLNLKLYFRSGDLKSLLLS